MNQPVILCGLGRLGWDVLEYLRTAGLTAVVVDLRCKPDDPRLCGAQVIQGDYRKREVLQQAGLADARGVLVLADNDLVNISTTLTIRQIQPKLRIVVRLFNPSLLSRLGDVVANVVALSVSSMTAPVLALTALTGEGLGTFSLTDGLRQVTELKIGDNSRFLGQRIADIAEVHRLVTVAYLPGRGDGRYLGEIEPTTRLGAGDRLVVCGEPSELAPLAAPGAGGAEPDIHWAGWLRRTGRILGRTFSEIELAVKISTVVLVSVIFISTVIYHVGMNKPTATSLFRTISLMSTGSDMHENELKEEWQKVFVSLTRLIGAALIAAFTAIFTNYLIRNRLVKALEIRRIPESGHIVVCGLGNMGFRIVEELLAREEKAVVIEKGADNRFIAVARRKGVAVIVGDATVPELLRQAHSATARAVIAATDDELANLEIALFVRELNPKQRVVLRLHDAYLAQVLREAANVRLALSTSTLAAPAFVAALFGDRIHSLILVAGRVLAVIDLVVHANDASLHDQTVRALTIDYRLLAVSIDPPGEVPGRSIQDRRLAADDTLTAILTLSDLARLLRREQMPAEWSVEVNEFAPLSRHWLKDQLKSRQKLKEEEAETRLGKTPFALTGKLTRGQAEDLIVNCRREQVMAAAVRSLSE